MKKMFAITTEENWWKGEVVIRYNLWTVAKLLIVIALLYALWMLLGLLWSAVCWLAKASWDGICWLWNGICWIGNSCWDGICWGGSTCWDGICWVANQWIWLLGLVILGILLMLLKKVDWKNFLGKVKNHSKTLLTLLLLLLAVVLLLTIRECSSNNTRQVTAAPIVETENTENIDSVSKVQEKVFNEAFDWVVTTRAYLDGVQAGDNIKKRALVGLKYVNGKSVEKMDFTGKTYQEAKEIIASEWRTLILESLNGVQLKEHQMVAITLFAMRNGKYGFISSEFLKEVKSGNLKSSSAMSLHKANGTERYLRSEARQYLWVIKNIWDGNISVSKLLDCPMFSYKKISLSDMYDNNGVHLWSPEMEQKLHAGNTETPRGALNL
ncbi:MAG: hypothetical protein IJZ30_02190 [Alphaproteobacteria bacterium]|nr:hypothetical protein [Alphaproteobacteria bacterium]